MTAMDKVIALAKSEVGYLEKASNKDLDSKTANATIGTTALLTEINWIAVASAAALAGVLSVLTSLAGLPEEEKM